MARALLAIAAVALAAAVIGGCGGSSSSSSSHKGLTITPSNPHPSSTVTFGFVAPTRAGLDGKVIDSYSLSVTGPAGANCKGSQEVAGAPVAKGATEHIQIGPAQLHANWCVGPYTARVFEIQRPYCKAGAVCPQYVRVAGIVARGAFTISR
jgi:hypothetical protein